MTITTGGGRIRTLARPRRPLLPGFAVIVATMLESGSAAAIIDVPDSLAAGRHYASRPEPLCTGDLLHAALLNAISARAEYMRLTASPSSDAASPDLKALEDLDLKRREQDIKLKELNVREREAEKALALARAPWWHRLDPLVLAIVAASLTMIGNMIVATINNIANLRQETTKNTNTLAQEQQKAKAALDLEIQRARYTLVLQAIGTGDPTIAEQNIKFFINAGLLDDKDQQIARALEKFRPVLPSPGGALREAHGMFSVGPLSIEVKVTGTVPDASGNPSVPVGHNGAAHVVEISNLSTVPVDVEISADLTANLLVFASGATWRKSLNAVASFTGMAMAPPTQVNEPLSRPVNRGSGSEIVRVTGVRWRNTGARGWTPWHYPSAGNVVALEVPPLGENGSIRAGRRSS